MLNLKKGLALVLAAATAFTFAPVANLGNAVQAEAAATSWTYDASASGKEWNGAASAAPEINLSVGTYVIETNKKNSTGVEVTVANGDEAATTPDSVAGSATTVSGIYTDTSKNQVLAFNVTNAGNIKFTLGEPTSNGDVTFNIYQISRDQTVASGDVASVAKRNKVEAGSIPVIAKNISNGITWDTANDELFDAYKNTDSLGNVSYKVKQGKNLGNYTFTAPAGVTSANAYLDVKASPAYITVTPNVDSTWNKVSLKAEIEGPVTLTVSFKAKSAGAIGGGSSYLFAKDEVIASHTYDFNVVSAQKNITKLQWTLPNGKPNYYSPDYVPTTTRRLTLNTDYYVNSDLNLNTLVVKSAKIDATAQGALTFVSENPTVASVDASGNVTALKAGFADIDVYAGASGSLDAEHETIKVVVSSIATDVITAQVNGEDVNSTDKPIDLDVSTSSVANAVKSVKIDAKSLAGKAITYRLVSSPAQGASYGDSSIANVSSDGTVTAGTNGDKDVYVELSTPADADGKVSGGYYFIKVSVHKKAASVITLDDITLDLGENRTKTVAPTSNTGADAKFSYDIDTENTDSCDIVSLNGNTLTAQAYGQTTLKVTQPETATTRTTVKKVKVNVLQNAAKAVSDLKVASSALTVKVGDTASAGASTTASGAAITYTSSDTDVATVAADGTITAVAPGTAVVTVKAAETDKVNAGTATIVVTVPSNPAKVTGLKVSNKKGAYVTVKWTSQGSNVNYRVYKKVGNGKWVGKNVAGSKTTLSVKKGAKVQVKVKSYVKDASGKTTWGPTATKAKTFKTDKK